MIASFPMYNFGDARAGYARLWRTMRARLGGGPHRLASPYDLHRHWRRPDLLLSMTCGLPLRMGLNHHIHLVGTPDYRVPGCLPGYYRSVLVQNRRSDMSPSVSAHCAVNTPCSQSGWAALVEMLGGAPRRVTLSGSHIGSAKMIAEGYADCAALDAVTWRLMCRALPELTAALRVVAMSDPTPGLPVIAGRRFAPQPIARALRQSIAAMPQMDRAVLGLHSLVHIPLSDYLQVPLPPQCSA